jgi:ribonuclease HI
MNARGMQVLSWSEERELVLMNDGRVTRCGRGTDSESAPDVTFCSPRVFESLQWRVVRELGSDHFPILIEGGAEEEKRGKGDLFWDWGRAQWDRFREQIRSGLAEVDWGSLEVRAFEDKFRQLVLSAARKWVGMKRRGGEGSQVREVARAEIGERDRLREEGGANWEEVSEAEKRVREKLREERRGRWRNMLWKGASCAKMWSVVRGAKRGRERGGRSGEMLRVGERVLVTARAKANAFVSMYERVSRVTVPRGRRLKARLNSILRSPGPESEDSSPITVAEVKSALEEMAAGKAAGPDGLHPRLLRMLPVEALSTVCRLFERSFREGVVPQCWRVGEIVPMLKAGKDPSKMGSYRPVCLTSCLGKWLERVLGNRLRWTLENAGCLSVFQAGFRKGKGVNDQLVRLSQAVWDGYQRREKTCLVLYDFERAFDRVWHDGMLMKLVNAGVCRTMIRWVQDWLKNRLGWVRFEGVRGRTRLFRQGLPQGSVLSPLLFLVYINDLVEALAGGGVGVSAFADDLAVWATGKGVEEGRRRVQWATNVVADWSREWLMTVSIEKCTVTLFSNDVRDREMTELSVWLHGVELRREKSPCFLGVKYDVGFTFRGHVDRVVSKAATGVRLLRCLTGCDWGWGKGLLRSTYVALVRSVLLYGSAAWAPWVSSTVWSMIERVQLEAARVVGGTLRSAPREAVLAEAGLCAVRRLAESMWMCELEKCLRAPEGDPRRDWGSAVVRRRLVRRTDWRTAAWGLLRSVVPDGVARSGWMLGERPWSEWRGVEWHVEGEKSSNVEADREAAVSLLRSLGTADRVLYTDGSAVEGVRCGGAAVVVTSGDPEGPVKLAVRACAAGMIASSYQAELCALHEALSWLLEHESEWERAIVVSDSQAALRALRGATVGRVSVSLGRVVGLGRQLGDRGKCLLFVWVPGHRGLVGNEWADEAAGAAATMSQDGVVCMFDSIRSLCRRREVVVFEHERSGDVYGEGTQWDLEKNWEREEAVSLARLRSGHSLELGGYRRRIGLEGLGTCRRCEEDVLETVEHVMSCVAGERKRFELGLSDRLSVLCCRPREALDYWRWWRRVRLK